MPRQYLPSGSLCRLIHGMSIRELRGKSMNWWFFRTHRHLPSFLYFERRRVGRVGEILCWGPPSPGPSLRPSSPALGLARLLLCGFLRTVFRQKTWKRTASQRYQIDAPNNSTVSVSEHPTGSHPWLVTVAGQGWKSSLEYSQDEAGVVANLHNHTQRGTPSTGRLESAPPEFLLKFLSS